jgi:hypothetical protein
MCCNFFLLFYKIHKITILYLDFRKSPLPELAVSERSVRELYVILLFFLQISPRCSSASIGAMEPVTRWQGGRCLSL